MKIIRYILFTLICITHITLTAQVTKIDLHQSSSDIKNIEEATKYLNIEVPNLRFIILNNYQDKLGFNHIKCQQIHNGHKVFGGEFIIHFNKENLYSIQGQYQKIESISNSIAFTKKDALDKILNLSNSKEFKWECDDNVDLKSPEVWIYNYQESEYRYIYKMEVFSKRPLNKYDELLDAEKGSSLNRIDKLFHIDVDHTGQTNNHNVQKFKIDSINSTLFNLRSLIGGGIHTVNMNESYNFENEFTNTTNSWNSTDSSIRAGVEVHWGLEQAYKYFASQHNYYSFDNNNIPIKAKVNHGLNFNLSNWDGDDLIFGLGNSEYNRPTSVDIVGHEFTHAIIQYSAGLINQQQSGSLAESFCDIFGYSIHQYADSNTASYRIGALISKDTSSAIRNIENPNEFNHPDTYEGDYWSNYGDVHINAGVQNFWFYLLVNGGSGVNDHGQTYNVQGIGLKQASEIAFRNLTVYLTPYSDFDDAHSGSIKAAKDLFGACSTEAIAVGKAWNAVGIGSPYTSQVEASFTSQTNNSCHYPFTTQFINNSVNNAINYWDFGDGQFSTELNPTHTYDTTGEYTVKLIVKGSALCGNVTDSIIRTDYIDVGPKGDFNQDHCNFNFKYHNNSRIYSIKFGPAYNYTSQVKAIVNNTCNIDYNVQAGKQTPLNVNGSHNRTTVFIDFDNSGSFSDDEIIIQKDNNVSSGITDSIILDHPNTVYNVPLRMRTIITNSDVEVDCSLNTPNNWVFGQQVDNKIYITPNEQSPTADFSIPTNYLYTIPTFNVGDTVDFTNTSENLPESYYWEFESGTPNSSIEENPNVIYNTPGIFDVKLIATNSFGQDSIVRVQSVSIINHIKMCETSSSNELTGNFFDSGGKNYRYNRNENCSFLINPECASSITLNFTSFITRSMDTIRIYDGPNANSPLLLQHSGFALPGNVTSSSGYMYITFVSKDYTVANYHHGWRANWTSTLQSSLPTANFTNSATTFPFNYPVKFNNTSTPKNCYFNWHMDGDTILNSANPIYNFTTSGTQNIELIADNCFGSDTIVKSIEIQNPPKIKVLTDTISISMNCGTDMVAYYSIINETDGDLVYNHQTKNSSADTLDILIFSIDNISASALTIDTLLAHTFTDISISHSLSTNPSNLELDLVDKDLIIIPSFLTISPIIDSIKYELKDFVNNGGRIIFTNNYSTTMNKFDLFKPIENGSYNSVLEIENYHTSLEYYNHLNFPNYSTSYHFEDSDYQSIISAVNNNHSAYGFKSYGLGEIFFIGYEYNNWSNGKSHDLLKSNVKYCINKTIPTILTPSVEYGTLSGFDTVNIPVTLSADNYYSGNVIDSILVYSNDTMNPVIKVYFDIDIEDSYSLNTVDSIIFDPIFQFFSDTLDFTLNNTACLDMIIDSITTTSANFEILNNPDTILNYSFETVKIKYSSIDSEILTDTLKIFFNNIEQHIYLNAQTLATVYCDFSTNHIEDSILYCDDSLEVSFTIFNYGENILTGYLHKLDSFTETNDSIFYEGFETNNLDNWIQSNSPGFAVGQHSTGNKYLKFPKTAPDTLNIYRPFQTNTPNYISFVMHKANMQHEGSRVSIGTGLANPKSGICEIDVNNYNIKFLVGNNEVYSRSLYQYQQRKIEFRNINYIDKTFDLYFHNSIVKENATFLNDSIPNSQISFVCGPSNSTTSGLLEIDDIYINHFHSSPWMASIDSMTINPGDSQDIQLTLFGQDLNSGTHSGYIYLSSNSDNYYDSIGVNLNIIGFEKLQIARDTLRFQTIQQYTSTLDSFMIYNEGCNDMEIQTITNTNSELLLYHDSITISPGDSTWIKVNFSPILIDTVENLIVINSQNDLDSIIIISQSEEAAVLQLDSNVVVKTITACEGNEPLNFSFENTGASLLNYEVRKSNSYLDHFDFYNSSTIWSSTNGIEVIQECDESINNSVLMFNGSSTRFITTKPLYLSSNSEISFQIKKPKSSHCNPPQNSERLYVKYSTDNGLNWHILNSYNPLHYSTSFSNINLTIPDYLLNRTLIFKLEQQVHDGTDTDIWIVDNFHIKNYYNMVNSNSIWPNESKLILSNLNYSDYSNGLNIITYNIKSNDPINPIQTYICSLYVNTSPCTTVQYEYTSDCNGEVQFMPNTRNPANSWYWDFGDSTYSTLSNPRHDYSELGLYNVTVIACNTNECDTVGNNVEISVKSGPKQSICQPYSLNINEHQITRFKLGNLNKQSVISNKSYEDFTCSDSIILFENISFPFEVNSTSVNLKQLSIWIDLNKDGKFNLSEQVFFKDNIPHFFKGDIFIPSTTLYNQPLRLRIIIDQPITSSVTPCIAYKGQFEDYTVIIKEFLEVPKPDFNFSETAICDGEFVFENTTTLFPSTYLWDFGDGTTSTEKNPTHNFPKGKEYTVRLTATNKNGDNTKSKKVFSNRFPNSVPISISEIIEYEPIRFSVDSAIFVEAEWDFYSGDPISGLEIEKEFHKYIKHPYILSLTSHFGCKSQVMDTLDLYILNGEQLIFYPNPTTSTITVANTIKDYLIYDTKGQLLIDYKGEDFVEDLSIDLSNFAEGHYIIKTKLENDQISIGQISIIH